MSPEVKGEGALASSILLVCCGLYSVNMKIREEAKLTWTIKNIMFNIYLFTVSSVRKHNKIF